ncbi:uncharacterized protein LOC127841962 isoform X4 [Dreissena polymorpha]|uniref:uncharacterized protein LOC127841962 isoform X4 n=1 Tax=Dreissena polymorpha TaxID=45954 RepID=UPI0022642FB6|nr:uncharacterized protein LOC127841962 isoform X4 [Dreissena polymorpha]
MDESDVDNMDIDAAFDWLEEKQINHQLQSLEEMKQLIRVHLRASSSDPKLSKSHKENVSDTPLQCYKGFCNLKDDGTHIMDKRDVDNMDIDAAFDWLEENQISHQLQSLVEMRQLIRVHLRASSIGAKLSTSHKSETDINEIVSKDKEFRKHMCFLYDELLKTIKNHPTLTDLYEYLSTRSECDIETKLQEHIDELQSMDCPIVIAGETSAGKSCFINLLLGEDVLPVSLLCATATICVIHPIPPGETPYFKVDGENSKCMGSKAELISQLNKILTCRSDTTTVKQVHVYWQVPLLGLNQHVVIVDTPGVGEDEQMTNKLFEYLPNAAAFIYLINCSNAGGVQEDKLVNIFRKVLDYDKSSGVFSFDSNCTLFVCNKWDVIKTREKEGEDGLETKVWEDIISKIKRYLPTCQLEQHVFKMSTTKALRYMRCGMGDTTEFSELKEGLKGLLMNSQTSRSGMHYRWLFSILHHIELYISAQTANFSVEQNNILYDKVITKLNNIYVSKRKFEQTLKKMCEEVSFKISHEIYQHLRRLDVQERILARLKGRYDCQKYHILEVVIQELKDWENSDNYQRQSFEKYASDIEQEIRLLVDECTVAEAEIANMCNMSDVMGDQSVFSSFITLMVRRGPIMVFSRWRPFYFDIFIHVFQKLHMQSMLRKIITQSFDMEHIQDRINKHYFFPMEQKIQKHCDIMITRLVEGNKKLLDSIVNHNANAHTQIREFRVIQDEFRIIREKLWRLDKY